MGEEDGRGMVDAILFGFPVAVEYRKMEDQEAEI